MKEPRLYVIMQKRRAPGQPPVIIVETDVWRTRAEAEQERTRPIDGIDNPGHDEKVVVFVPLRRAPRPQAGKRAARRRR